LKGQDWYGHRNAGQNAIDALIDLNRKAASTAAEGATVTEDDAATSARREAAYLLWEAFLADLDDAFTRRRAVNWTFNSLVLLDNADGGAGKRFLSELVEARKRRAADRLEPDPLTVVTPSKGPARRS
jgi:hypothetical protein